MYKASGSFHNDSNEHFFNVYNTGLCLDEICLKKNDLLLMKESIPSIKFNEITVEGKNFNETSVTNTSNDDIKKILDDQFNTFSLLTKEKSMGTQKVTCTINNGPIILRGIYISSKENGSNNYKLIMKNEKNEILHEIDSYLFNKDEKILFNNIIKSKRLIIEIEDLNYDPNAANLKYNDIILYELKPIIN